MNFDIGVAFGVEVDRCELVFIDDFSRDVFFMDLHVRKDTHIGLKKNL